MAKQGLDTQQNFRSKGIKLKDRDSIIFLYYFFVIKMVQRREERITLSPVALLFLGMRGLQAHQRLNVTFEPILYGSWGSQIRRKVIAVRKTYNDLRVGSNPSGCLHGGRKILREGTAFILVYMQTFQWEGTSKDHVWLWCHNVLWISIKNSFSTQRTRTPITYNTSVFL